MSKSDKDWYRYANEEAVSDSRTREALDHTLMASTIRNRATVVSIRRKPSKVSCSEKMFPTQHFSDLFSFPASSIRLWCSTGELEAQWIKGEWRISESAFMKFLEKENRKRG